MRLFATVSLFALSAFAGCTPTPGTPAADDALPIELEARIAARLDALDATTSVFAFHIPTGREVAVRADQPMNTLSVIKIPAMVLAFRDHAEGRLDLDARITIGEDDLRRGSGLVQTFQVGLQPTLRDLVRQMIITSDNTATDLVANAVGLDRVNQWLESQGYEQTAFRMTTGDLFREVWVRADPEYGTLTDREIFERGFPADAEASARSFVLEGDSTAWLGRTTAREMTGLLAQILREEVASPEHSAEMIDMLMGQLYSSRLPQRVQWTDVAVAHKTGDWPPIAGNDVGILFYDGGPTIVSAFATQNTGDFFEVEATLGLIAADLVEAWR